MAELAGGTIARGIVDVYPAPQPRPRVRLRMARVQRVLGVAPPRADALRHPPGLGLPVRERGDDVEVEVPSFRRDLAMEDDLVEEIIRVWGYDRIPSTPPTGAIQLVTQPDSVRQEAVVRRALVGAGLTEVVTYSFSGPDPDGTLPRPRWLPSPCSLLNPLGQDASLMRRHPLEGMLGAVAINLRRQQPNVALFEIGRTYGRPEGTIREAALGSRSRWRARVQRPGVGTAAGAGRRVRCQGDMPSTSSRRFDSGPMRLRERADPAGLEPDTAGALEVGGRTVRDLRRGGSAPCASGSASIRRCSRCSSRSTYSRACRLRSSAYEPLPRYPSVARDVAFRSGRRRTDSRRPRGGDGGTRRGRCCGR